MIKRLNKLLFFSIILILTVILLGCKKDECKNISCNDNNLCTIDACNPDTGSCTNKPISCVNGYYCNQETGKCEIIDKCKNINCDDKNPCTIDSCDSTIGTCVNNQIICPSGMKCDSKNGFCLYVESIAKPQTETYQEPIANVKTSKVDLTEQCNKKDFKIAFILLTKDVADPTDLENIDKIKSRAAEDFRYATDNLASIDTSYPLVVINYNSVSSDVTKGFYNGKDVAKEFYKSNPDEFDFIVINTDLNIFENSPFFEGVISPIEGISHKVRFIDSEAYKSGDPKMYLAYDTSEYYGSNHKLLGLLNLASIKERIPGIRTEEEIIRGRIGRFLHELGHNWCCYIGDPYTSPNGRLKIIDQSAHWNPYFDHGSDPLTLHSSRTYWKDEGNGIFSSSTDFGGNRMKYHPFILYFMGLKKPEEIPEKFKVITPEGNEWADEENKKVLIKGSVNYITIQEIIDVVGPRSCLIY